MTFNILTILIKIISTIYIYVLYYQSKSLLIFSIVFICENSANLQWLKNGFFINVFILKLQER